MWGFTVLAGISSEVLDLLDTDWSSGDSIEWFIDFFNLDSEFNFPSFYSAFLLLLSSALLWAIAACKRFHDHRYARHWQLLAYIFLYLVIDEVFSLHELLIIPALRDRFNLDGIFHQTWVIPGVIFIAIFIWKYWRFAFDLNVVLRRLFFLAAGVYVGGALGMEMVGGILFEYFSRSGPQAAAGIVLEESMEMLGMTIFCYVLLRGLQAEAKQVTVKFHFAQIAPPTES
jgi:uncharacterized membrane protein YhaH (DUF805 family)